MNRNIKLLTFLLVMTFFFGCTSKIFPTQNNLETKIAQANDYANQSKFQEAEKIYDEMLKEYPNSAIPYGAKGTYFLVYKNDTVTARKLLKIATEKPDAGSQTYVSLGAVAISEENYVAAIAYFEKAISMKNDNKLTNELAHKGASIAYLHLGQTDEGLAHLKQVIELNPEGGKIWLSKAVSISSEIAAGNPIAANRINDYVLIEDPDFANAYVMKGRIATIQYDFTGAKRYYEIALTKDPENAFALSGLCEIHIQDMEWVAALEDCEKSIVLGKTGYTAYFYGAAASLQTGNNQKAREYIDKAILLAPNDPGVKAAAGSTYLMLAIDRNKRNESAELVTQDLLKSIEYNRNETPAEAYFLLATYYYNQSDLQRAKMYIGSALEKASTWDNVAQRKELGIFTLAQKIYSETGDTTKAVELNQTIAHLAPSDKESDLPLNLTNFQRYGYANAGIYILPMDMDPQLVSDLVSILVDKFKFRFILLSPISTPSEAYDSHKGQYYAELINDYLRTEYGDRGQKPILAITSRDITSQNTNFVYGYALSTQGGVVSTYRFTSEFNNETTNQSLFFKRVLVQSMSTLGSSLGLSRPTNPTCALAYAHGFSEAKTREPIWCASNQRELESMWSQYEWVNFNGDNGISYIYAKYGLTR